MLARRVKITARGKILHSSNFNRHLKRNKSASQKRRLKQNKEFTGAFVHKVKKALGIV
ncbi:MAG: large ribosomal subunit protein bL35 [Microgenomates group bacterium]